MAKSRLDVLLVEQGKFASREQARAAIMAREVTVDGVVVDKAGTGVKPEAVLAVTGRKLPYVSRGGLKLEKAVAYFNLDLAGLTALDIGASTGGFTDCALQNGVLKVYAVDVGYGQLAWSLRQNPAVVVLEKTNARYLTAEQIPEPIDLVTIDASFISLTKLLPAAVSLMREGAMVVALIKPQFEAGRENVGSKGVVRDRGVHLQVINEVITAAEALGLGVQGLTHSPVRGPEGNIEYLLWLKKGLPSIAGEVQAIVDGAFDGFGCK